MNCLIYIKFVWEKQWYDLDEKVKDDQSYILIKTKQI